MKEFKEILNYFQIYLEGITNQLVEDLKYIAEHKPFRYLKNINDSDVRGYFFEYDYEYFNINLYCLDSDFNQVAKYIKLPKKVIEESKKDALIPKRMWDFEIEAEETYSEKGYDEDEFYDIFDDYSLEKHKIFKDWFLKCWKQMAKNTEIDKKAYFSVHDSNCYTDLITMKEITESEIIL